MDTLPQPGPADSPALLSLPDEQPFATVITQDGRPLRLFREGTGTIRLEPPRPALPWRLDRYQSEALTRSIGDALNPPGGFIFERGIGR